MDETDEIKVRKAIRIARELTDVMRDSQNDCAELKSFVEENPYAGEAMVHLSDPNNYQTDDNMKQASVTKLVATLENHKRVRRTQRRLLSLSAAAVVLGFVTVFSILFMQKKRAADQEFMPSRPTLILSNGQSIDLINAEQTIETESFIVKKINDNKLSYTARSTKDTLSNIYNTIIVPALYTFNVMLDDGTEITLNAGSELRYPVKFSADSRKVFLKGEAYFSVSKSATPFLVVTEDVVVKVYGTKFLVNSDFRSRVETVLISGSVGVSGRKQNRPEVMLQPSELCVIDKQSMLCEVSTVDTNEYTAWLDDYFRFTKMPLETITEKLSLWYGVAFEFESEHIRDRQLTLSLSMKLPIEEVLSIIESVTEVKFSKEGGRKYEVK